MARANRRGSLHWYSSNHISTVHGGHLHNYQQLLVVHQLDAVRSYIDLVGTSPVVWCSVGCDVVLDVVWCCVVGSNSCHHPSRTQPLIAPIKVNTMHQYGNFTLRTTPHLRRCSTTSI